VFTPALAKHSKSFSLIDCISDGVDRMQRNFEPMRKQVKTWQKSEVRGLPAEDDLESLERVHIGIQTAGSHPTIQGDGEAGRVPRGRPLKMGM
jgi:hypothetical protein